MTELSRKPTYDDWNNALAGYFYNPSQQGKPVYLQVDDDVLRSVGQELGIAPENARKSFIEEVRHRSRFKDDPFFRFFHLKDLNSDPQNKVPPFIAFLGLCVLAAFDMEHEPDKGLSSANYYERLENLLGVKKPGRFSDVGELWERLNRWLDEDLGKAYGKATAGYVNHRHVGYPISQALVRTVDRQKLPDFFIGCHIAPDQEWVTPDYFKDQLQQLAGKTTWPFSNRVRRIFENKDTDAVMLVARIIHAEYSGWDGRSTEQIRLGILPTEKIALQLEINYDDFECSLYPRARNKSGDLFPEGAYQSFRSVRLKRDPYLLNWFASLPDDPFLTEFFAEKEIKLQSTDGRFRQQISPAPIMFLREDSDGELGGYVHFHGQPALRETYQILCHERLRNQIKDYFDKNGRYGEILASGNPVYKGWVCFRDVRLVRRDEDVPDELARLIPQKVGLSLHRRGGLKLGRDQYLLGGEPEVEITADNEHETVVHIDDKPYITFSTESLSINLQDLGWQSGRHTIRVGNDGRCYSFYIVASGEETRKPFSPLSHHIKHEEPVYRPESLALVPLPLPESRKPHYLYITGAHLKGSADDLSVPIVHPVRVPYGKPRCIILGRRVGDVLETRLPDIYPEWRVKQLGWSNGIYVTVRFKPQWIVRIKGNQKVLTAVGIPDDPVIPDTIKGDKEKWVQWARKKYRNVGQYTAMWERYRQVAEEME